MGPSLVVGIYPELSRNDPGNLEYYREQFKLVNEALHHAHIAEHREPDKAEGAPWSCDMRDFKTLHYLRRFAAYLALKDEIPLPGDDDAAVDPITEEWCMWATNQQPGLIAGLLGDRVEAPIAFEHLMVHSDASGFYLPQPFHRVVIAPEHLGIVGQGLIGSAYSLRDDCKRIAAAIDLPLDLDPESDEVSEAFEKQGKLNGTWQRYGRESFACLQLHRAASIAIASGCAIVLIDKHYRLKPPATGMKPVADRRGSDGPARRQRCRIAHLSSIDMSWVPSSIWVVASSTARSSKGK